ncbi:aconitate hydratase AcnA [Cupriavidus oxalaticus]|uniref:aconitate hydratase AcnA n=1 Tax=Cupriavidus oxalaticus TaxID=96344 RepID=UPI00403342A0
MAKTCFGQLECGGKIFRYVDVNGLLGAQANRLPMVLRILFENAMRHAAPAQRDQLLGDFLGWLHNRSSAASIEFRPLRLLMEDTTSTPAFVDVAAMRDALVEAGGDPDTLNPVLRIDASMDHSIAVHHFGSVQAAELNSNAEFEDQKERFEFLRWVSRAMQGVKIHPPGTGIMHTLNLEQLTTVASTIVLDDVPWAIPDTVVGTDSHTPLINGAGVLGWGIGGLEAEATMLGAPIILRMPDVVGVRLSGRLPAGVLATDLALHITHALRKTAVSGEFVEFFGASVSSLSIGERCTVASMAPEYGATTGYFPIDERTLAYFKSIGRSDETVALIEALAKRSGLWFAPAFEPAFTRIIDVDLDSISRCVAGPKRPNELLPFGKLFASLPSSTLPSKTTSDLPRFPVAIAAITSCTNTTDPALLIAAGILAKKARALGLSVPAWVKTSLAPGSPSAREYLDRCGLLEELAALGFNIVGYGCTTCIGNSGALPAVIAGHQAAKSVRPVAILSGNRNFPGRVHPDIDLSYIMSPPLVVALALAGNAEVDLEDGIIGAGSNGLPVRLSDIWPTAEEIQAQLVAGLVSSDVSAAFSRASKSAKWDAVLAPSGDLFPWSPTSTFLKRPPYATTERSGLPQTLAATPLLVLGDDVTTDHIAPGSAIPADSPAGLFLASQKVPLDQLGAFSARRGNWEVMLRATFYNRSLTNLLAPAGPAGHTLHSPSGEMQPIFEVANRYKREGRESIVVAGARYGSGSSRDWAAKGPWLLGIRAVIAVSIERIHRQNLVGMGILPLIFPVDMHPTSLALSADDRLDISLPASALKPRGPIGVVIVRSTGEREAFTATAAVETEHEAMLLRSGGIIPMMLQTALRHKNSH